MAVELPVMHRFAPPRDRRRLAVLGAAVMLLAALAITAAAAAEAPQRPGLVALARGAMVAIPVAVGLYAWHTRLDERAGLLLAGLGAAWFVTTLAESSDPTLYTIGRVAGWSVEVVIVYVFLALAGRGLTTRADRLLVAAMGAAVAILYLPRLLLAQRLETPSPVTSCVRDCPANPLFALGHEPAVLHLVVRPLGVVVTFVLMVAVVVRLQQRLSETTPLTRRALTPVVAIATARASLLAVGIFARWIDPSTWLVRSTAWLLALAVPALALAFLAGLVRGRLFAGHALERLAACVRAKPDAATLRRAFAEAFDDPSVEIVFPASRSAGSWMDAQGHAIALPEPDSGLRVSAVEQDEAPVAAIVHDEALSAHPQLLRAGLAMTAVALENQRLAAEAGAAMRELEASRSRIAASAERERRRIERDLHDGAQQRLVALRIELELAEELVRRDPEAGARRLRTLEHELDTALEELRALAHGVYPPLLADRGLVEALHAVLDRFAVPARLDARAVGRYASEVESAVYFCVLEALQNVLKHADGASHVEVRLDGGAPGELRFGVRDDGAGASGVPGAGAGITNMRDRLAALGGELDVRTGPGAGTLVQGWAPTAAGRRPPASTDDRAEEER